MEYIVKILEIHKVTHDVKSFRFEKPVNYTFTPGHATDVSVNKKGWEEEKRPFTFTSLNEYPYLEFTIKRYEKHNGVTNQVHLLKEGDELIIRDVWGAIEYKGAGWFIAGGAGITPFIAILRQLHKDGKLKGNKLLFTNKTAADIIYRDELSHMLGNDFINVLTEEKNGKHESGRIDKAFLKKEIPDFSKHFYVCGPDKMIADVNSILNDMGAIPDNVVFEK
jgi:glycine betaine catabolism B